MQAIVLREIGGPQNLHREEIDTPVAGPGEILVRIRRAAFNRRDVFITQGLYPGIVFPVIPGSDACGVVAAHGPDAAGPAAGTTVVIDPMLGWGDDPRLWSPAATILGMPHQGTFAEYVAVPAANVHPKPARLTDEEAAAIPLAGLTAYRAIHTRGRCTANDVVLLPGIGGGVQTFALQFAKAVGARTIVTSSSDAKLERARALGADVTINYATSANWSKDVRAQSDGGPTLVIDSVGGETFARALDVARPGARVVTYGGTTGDAKIRMFSVFWKHLDILGTSMGSPADFRAMLALFEAGGFVPAIDEVVDFDDVPAAAQRVLDAEQFGKVVVRVSDEASAP
jgi:NADPH:quinone reductase-like Zn-dependent oxidoreductase